MSSQPSERDPTEAPQPGHGLAFLTNESDWAPVPLTFRAYFGMSRAIILLIAIALSVSFLPVVIVTYGFVDDYPLLALANGFGPDATLREDPVLLLESRQRPRRPGGLLAGRGDQAAERDVHSRPARARP